MIPWRSLLVFIGISVGTAAAIALLCVHMGWSIHSPAWAALAPIVMWAPAFGRFAARHTVDRGFNSTLTLGQWGTTGAQVILWPIAVPLIVYSAAYAIACRAGFAYWSPGGGKWTTGPQIAANLLVNISILGVVRTFTALGEEIGWRGYLQPRLDAAGVRWSVVVVSLCQLAYHAPLMAGTGYADAGGLFTSLALFAVGDLPVAFLWARESYRAGTVWPAVFFHSFHNTISQWLFPKFFAGGENELWLGEGGLLPVAGYVVVGVALFIWMRWRGRPWQALVRHALTTSTTEPRCMGMEASRVPANKDSQPTAAR
jgi:membrane protease YdiL (CAAX protease family)